MVRRVRSLIEQYSGRRPAPVQRRDDDMQIIKFSGGSTGTPKPVVQSVRVLDAQARGLLEFFEFDASDVNLIAAPLTHGTSCFVLPILAAGGRHVLVEDPKAPIVADALSAYGITTLYAPPTLIYALLDEPSIASRSFPRLRHLIYSAAPMSAERIREAQRVFGPVVETAYGQVEAPQIVTAMRASEMLRDENLASIGRASSVARVEIMSDSGELLPSGSVGEIVVQGPLVMSGYLDRPALTAETIRNGWLHTGDLGYIDERGYVFIRGRLREVINTGGFKVFPGDVEVVLARHPAVAGVLRVRRGGSEVGRGDSRGGDPGAWRRRRRQRAHRIREGRARFGEGAEGDSFRRRAPAQRGGQGQSGRRSAKRWRRSELGCMMVQFARKSSGFLPNVAEQWASN